MSVSIRHVLEQGPMLRTLALAALTNVNKANNANNANTVPGPWISASIAPPSSALIRAFVKNAGGEPSTYKDIVPPHLFPQWAMPVAFEAIAKTKYPLTHVMNAGCTFEQTAPLPAGERLVVKACLASIDDNERRAILTTRIVTGTASTPDALVSEIHAFVPHKRQRDREPKAPIIVPIGAREIAFVRLGADAGFDFAKLTGDFNPIHWVNRYARAAGFRSTILHGFGTFAFAVEAVVRRVLSGNARALASVSARFTKPLTLPNNVGVYVARNNELFVGNGEGAPAYLTGHFATHARTHEEEGEFR